MTDRSTDAQDQPLPVQPLPDQTSLTTDLQRSEDEQDSSQTADRMPQDGPQTLSAHSALTQQIAGYEIIEELGRGGMGVVYKAKQSGLDRYVALKMILHADHADDSARLRFEREAKAIAKLDHPNIVQIHEIGEHEGKPYFSLELVQGGNLDEKLDGQPLPAMEAARLVESLARVMQVAHKANVLHRDLKPANVLLTEDNVPKITDFGLAKKLDDVGQTQSGAIIGTPSYAAPEQLQPKNEAITATADVYALGAILYECLTGRPPFKGPDYMNTILQVIGQLPVPLSQLQPRTPRDLETICLKCLEKESIKRYASMEELADDLRRFQNGEPIHARPVGGFQRAWRWYVRNPSVAVLGTVILALLLITSVGATIGAVLINRSREAEKTTAQANQRLANEEAAAKSKALTALRELRRARNTSKEILTLLAEAPNLARLSRQQRVQQITKRLAKDDNGLRSLIEEKLNFIGRHGAGACSNVACHGGQNTDDVTSNALAAYTIWRTEDPHSQAFESLKGERAKRIVERLRPLNLNYTEEIIGVDEAPVLCLNCHAPDWNVPQFHRGRSFALEYGVSCEACHGPSGDWIDNHFDAQFEALGEGDKHTAYQLWPTKNVSFLAQKCAECHVGTKDKQLNHELIAAGHPWPQYELTSYLNKLPAHWDPGSGKARHSDYHARLWLIGQIQTARAAINLLGDRAQRATTPNSKAAWPEFSEYECFACHKDLRYGRRLRPLSFPWQTAPIMMLQGFGEIEHFDFGHINKLRQLMQSPNSEPATVAMQSELAAHELDVLLDNLRSKKSLETAKLRQYFQTFLKRALNRAKFYGRSYSYDEARQLYHALVSLNQALRDKGDDKSNNEVLIAAIRRLKKEKLDGAFPEGFDSPGNYDPLAEPTLEDLLKAIENAFNNTS